MARRDPEPPCLRLGDSGWMIYALLAVLFLAGGWFVGQGAEQDTVAQGAFLLLGAVLLAVAANGFLHRRDHLEIGRDALRLITWNRTVAIAWDAVTSLHFDRALALHLTVSDGQRRIKIPLAPSVEPGIVADLMGNLDKARREALQRMADGPVRLPASWIAWPAILGMVVLPLLLLVASRFVPALGQRADSTMDAMLLFLAIIMIVGVWKNQATIGPDELRFGWQRVPLGEVKAVILRTGMEGESWVLDLGSRSVTLRCLVDEPLVYEHIIRRCPTATWRYEMTQPRSALAAVLLPVPPGAPAALMDPSARESPGAN